ncbi:MAG: hypothetical protein CVU89_06955 [Firmicutes bacterium HGW-Firmicutes-14]|nr:MAG: hypothetical protein CVU89_06955 [Firmicutes bacterium HGW-Firmicutes-14]
MHKIVRISGITLLLFSLFLGLAVTSILPAPVSAAAADQTGSAALEMTELDLQVWPEYDDPRVLAIFNGTLTNVSGKEYQGRVYFNVPKDIEVKMACELINGGQHSCQPYELEDKGDYQVLSWKITRTLAPGEKYPIWLEYYYSALNGYPDKTMAMDFTPYYKTLDMKVTVKEPLKSSDFKIDPAPTTTGQDGEGFNNYMYNFRDLDSNKPVKLNISYTRSEKDPSVDPPDPNANQQQDTAAPLGTSAWKKPEVLIPVILFIIVLGIFIFYALNNSNNRHHSGPGRSGRNGSPRNSKNRGRHNSSPQMSKEKKRIRQMLLDGKITEETYRELLADIENEA